MQHDDVSFHLKKTINQLQSNPKYFFIKKKPNPTLFFSFRLFGVLLINHSAHIKSSKLFKLFYLKMKN